MSCKNMVLIILSNSTSWSIQASIKVTVAEASVFVDADSSVVKCLVLSRQGDGCRIEAQVRFPSIPSIHMFSFFATYLSVSSKLQVCSRFFYTIYYFLYSNFHLSILNFHLSILNFHLSILNFHLSILNFHLSILRSSSASPCLCRCLTARLCSIFKEHPQVQQKPYD